MHAHYSSGSGLQGTYSQSTSSSGWSPLEIKLPLVPCPCCGKYVTRFVSGTEANHGRPFYKCDNKRTNCRVWMWDNDYESFLDMVMRIVLKEIARLKDDISNLKRENSQLIANLNNQIGEVRKDNSEIISMLKTIKLLFVVMLSFFIVIYSLKR